ncbi:MAG: hypothetical protein KDI66_17040, partial [Xanthomonadales bacterium]|nr:hypothetical protein [Xanthomonadales bacterium]
ATLDCFVAALLAMTHQQLTIWVHGERSEAMTLSRVKSVFMCRPVLSALHRQPTTDNRQPKKTCPQLAHGVPSCTAIVHCNKRSFVHN